MAYDTRLADAMRAALAVRDGISEQAMFGGLCWMMNGHMLCGTSDQRFMFRVGKEAEAAALRRPGAIPMQFGKRRMGGLVWVEADSALATGLDSWIDLAAKFARGLPPKKGKGK